MMIPAHLPSGETNPTLCCWFCSTLTIPVPVTQTGTGSCCFAGMGMIIQHARKWKSGVSYRIKEACAVSMESAGFHGKSAAELQQAGHAHSMAPAGVAFPPLCSSIQLLTPICRLRRNSGSFLGGRNLLNCGLPVSDDGKYVRHSVYYV